jgi:hypothetical protein
VSVADVNLPYYGRVVLPNRAKLNFLQEDMGDVVLGLKGRNEAVFFTELLFAMLVVAAKIITRDPARDKMPDDKKIGQIMESLRLIHPTLPKLKCINNWCEGLIGGLIYLKLLPFELPHKFEKMPRLASLEQIANITYGHLETIVHHFGSMGKLREFIRPPSDPPKPTLDPLDQVLCILRSGAPLSEEQIEKLGQLVQAAEPHLAGAVIAATNLNNHLPQTKAT